MITFTPMNRTERFHGKSSIKFVASMKANYNDLVKLFGEPLLNVTRSDRLNFEWYIKDEEDNYFIVYDWIGSGVSSPNKRTMKEAQFVRWNIGSSSYKLARKLIAWLKIKKVYAEEVGNWIDQCVNEEFTIGDARVIPIINDVGNILRWETHDAKTNQLLKQYETKERAREFADKWSRLTFTERQKIMHGKYKPLKK